MEISISEKAAIPSVKVMVGPDRTEFIVNKSLVSSESKLFRKNCAQKPTRYNGATVYRETTLILLPSCKPKNFTIFLDWARTKILSAAPGIIQSQTASSKDGLVTIKARQHIATAHYDQLCDLLIDSCTIESKKFEHAINEAMFELCRWIFSEFGISEGVPVKEIANICKATSYAPLRIMEPQLSVQRAEKWMYDHDGCLMLHNALRQFCDEFMITSMIIRLRKSKSVDKKKNNAKLANKVRGKGLSKK